MSIPPEMTSQSKGPHGALIFTNVFVDPPNIEACIAALTSVARRLREAPECLFCELSQNPNDSGHIRISHGWTKNSAWFVETVMQQPWFQEYLEKSKHMMAKPREWPC